MPKETNSPQSELSIDAVAQFAVEILLKDGFHLMTLIADGSKDRLITQLSDIASTHEARAKQLYSAGYYLARSGQIGTLLQFIHISEAWMSVATSEQVPHVTPSKDPKRKEVLVVSGIEVREDKRSTIIHEMVRDRNKRLKAVNRLQEQSGTTLYTPLLEAFISGFFSGEK